jgi:glycosyltransferase involved in cell wall biosynthesis
MPPSRKRSVVALVQLPPPVTGLSTVNAEFLRRLEAAGVLMGSLNLAPESGRRHVAKVIDRAFKTIAACGLLLRLRRSGAQIVYMPSDGGLGLMFNIVLATVARALRYRLWTHHHSFAYINRWSPLMWTFIAVAPKGTTHIGLCDEMLRKLSNRYARVWKRQLSLAHALPNAFMVNPGQSRALTSAPALRLGHLSNLTIEKGALAFVEIVERLIQRGVPVEAHMAGPIVDPRVREAVGAAAIRLGSQFRWHGSLYDEAKRDFYRDLDAFVFPSRYVNEAQPLVLLEALAEGACLIVTDRGCMACDHRDSPGFVGEENNFEQEATDWLARNMASAYQRADIRTKALARFAVLKADAEKRFSIVLSALHYPAA